MICYMLDTNACIGVINGKPPALQSRLLGLSPDAVGISEIVRYELEFEICRSQHQERNCANLTHFLRYIRVLDWSETQSVEAAQVRCELTRQGQPIGHYDIRIAAHAFPSAPSWSPITPANSDGWKGCRCTLPSSRRVVARRGRPGGSSRPSRGRSQPMSEQNKPLVWQQLESQRLARA